MKIKKQLATLRLFAIAVLMLLPSFVSFGVFQPPTASAAACDTPTGGGGGGLLHLSASAALVDSSVDKVTSEFTPSQTWGSSSRFDSGFGRFVKADCSASNAWMYSFVTGTNLEILFDDSSTTTAMQAGTDYDNLDAAASISTSSNEYGRSARVSYTMAAITSGVAQQISVDLGTNPGWANVYLKQGAGAETLIISFKTPADTTSFGGQNGYLARMVYSDEGFSGDSCNDITGSKEVKARMLADGTAIELTATPYTYALCANFDKTSYDAGTKTASLKYDTVGETPMGTILDAGNQKTTVFGLEGGESVGVNWATSLQTNSYEDQGKTEYYLANGFTSSSNASQQLYLALSSHGENTLGLKDRTPYPVAGGVFDFSSGADKDLAAAGVKAGTSGKTYASFAHNFGKVTKDGKFSLFVPQRKGDKNVGVCPGATKLSDVKLTCKDVYLLSEGQTANGATASLVTVGANTFWRVDGLTGTGIFSSSVSEIPGAPDTGLEFLQSRPGVIALVSITGAGAIYLAKRRFVRVLGR